MPQLQPSRSQSYSHSLIDDRPITCPVCNGNGQGITAIQLIGARKLLERTAAKSSSSEKVLPIGPGAKGIVVYTADGYVSAHLLRPGQA